MASFLLTKDNKFKVGDIITIFKEPTWYFRPAKEWINNINMVSATWKVISVDDKNGDYKLQRLDTLTLTPLLEDGGPIYQTATMNKGMIDDGDYRLWDKNDVRAVYNSVLDKVNLEKRLKDTRLEAYNKEMATNAPFIKEYFKKNNSIEATADNFRLDNEEVWDVLDENELKGAKDYDSVKEELFGEDDENFENFETVTQDVLKYNQKNALNKEVLGNPDLAMTIGEYFRTSKKRGTKSRKGGKKSKKRGTKSTKRGKKSKKRGTKSKKKRHKIT
jgi:hypothetical protein